MKRNVLLLTLALGVLASSAALAQSNLGLKGVGVTVGYVSPENLDGTFSLGMIADHGTLAPKIGLESRIEYWSWSEEFYGAESSVRDITLGARGKYQFETKNPKLQPFVGTGLGLHFIHSEVRIPAQGGFPQQNVDDSTTKLGLDLGGGISTPINPRTDFLAEAWYGIVTDVSNFSLRAGISHKLK